VTKRLAATGVQVLLLSPVNVEFVDWILAGEREFAR